MLVTQLQGSIKISVELPVMLRVDNVGVTFMASNITTAFCTKDLDISYKNVNGRMEKVKKMTDILTKILSAEKNSKKMVREWLEEVSPLKIFEAKKKGVRDVVLISSI